MSDVIELAGLACLAAAALLFAGVAACLLVAGVSLLFVGYTLDGSSLQKFTADALSRRAQRRLRRKAAR